MIQALDFFGCKSNYKIQPSPKTDDFGDLARSRTRNPCLDSQADQRESLVNIDQSRKMLMNRMIEIKYRQFQDLRPYSAGSLWSFSGILAVYSLSKRFY